MDIDTCMADLDHFREENERLRDLLRRASRELRYGDIDAGRLANEIDAALNGEEAR